jgi:HAD superfamily hydrolase (TIGR01509 family)
MTRRALIVDFDGVLIDSEPLHFEGWNRAFGELLGIPRRDDPLSLVGLGLEDIYRAWTQTELSAEVKTQLLTRKNEYFFSQQLTIMPGALELLQNARKMGWYVAIASRSLRPRLFRTLEVMQMPALFDVVLCGEDVVNPVSNRKDHALAAQIFGIHPEKCVVIEDSVSGIQDALTGRIGRVIGITSSFEAERLLSAGAHEVVAQLSEIVL